MGVLCEVDDAHSAVSEDANDAVPAELFGQPCCHLWHLTQEELAETLRRRHEGAGEDWSSEYAHLMKVFLDLRDTPPSYLEIDTDKDGDETWRIRAGD